MKCKVADCNRDAMYKSVCMCQKHYFRVMRNGTLELKRDKKIRTLGYSREYKHQMPGRGYIRCYEPNHKLADTQGYVSEHRLIAYDKYGDSLPNCELCDKPLDWDNVHIDHKDNIAYNNTPSNIRPLCRICNTRRNRRKECFSANNYKLTFNGITQTPEEWSRSGSVFVTGSTIRRRLKLGMSEHDALFSAKKTHK